MDMYFLLLIFLLGVLTPVQTAANARLRLAVGSPLVASLVSFSVGTLYLMAATLIQKGSLGFPADAFGALPRWAWFGGICGLLTCSLLIDKYGLLGAEKKPVGAVQYLGLLCVIAGIAVLRLN